MTARVALVLLTALLAGCSVGLGELSPNELAVNECENDSSCRGGRCEDRVCVATDGDLTALLVTVTPSGTVPGAASVTYYQDFPKSGTKLDTRTRVDVEVARPIALGTAPLDKDAPATAQRAGTVSSEFAEGCKPSFNVSELEPSFPASEAGLIPADITLTSTRRVPGIPADTYRTELEKDRFTFRANVPPGNYDVYIRPAFPPSPANTDTCQEVAPRLFLNQAVLQDVSYKLPPAAELQVRIRWPRRLGPADEDLDPQMLDGWTVDLIEPALGRAISTTAKIKNPPTEMGGADWTYDVTLHYAPIYGEDAEQTTSIADELIRLTPPSGVTAPLLYAVVGNAQALNPTDDHAAGIVLSSPLPTPVNVEVQTTLAGQPVAVPANVTLTAKELDGVFGLATGFSRTLEIGMGGLGAVSLLPGKYRVRATPLSACLPTSCLATTVESEWIVAAEPAQQGGKTIEFSESARIEGHAYVASTEPAVGATVRAVASPLIVDTSVLNVGDGRSEVLPRATAGVVGSDGGFYFEADNGIYNLRIEPDPTTGFGWLVLPTLTVPTGDVLRLDLPLPVQYSGRVTVDGGEATVPVPNALVRAYVYVTRDGEFSPKLVDGAVGLQVAETHADEDGNFVLLIPRKLGVDE